MRLPNRRMRGKAYSPPQESHFAVAVHCSGGRSARRPSLKPASKGRMIKMERMQAEAVTASRVYLRAAYQCQ